MSEKLKKYKNYILLAIVILVVLALVLVPMILEKTKAGESDGASIRSGTVESGSVSKTLSGTGTLTAEEAEDIDVPEGVEVTKYLVSNSDTVKEGDPLAIIDRNSVRSAMFSVYDSLKQIEHDMAYARGDEVSENLTDKTGLKTTGEFEVLADTHREYEEMAARLAQMYNDGYIKAPCDGMVSGIDEDAAAKLMAADEDNSYRVVQLAAQPEYQVVMLADIDSTQQSTTTTTVKTDNLFGTISLTVGTDGSVSWNPLILNTNMQIPVTISPETVPDLTSFLSSMQTLKQQAGKPATLTTGDQFTIWVIVTYDESTPSVTQITSVSAILYSDGKNTPGGGGTSAGGVGGSMGTTTTTTEEELFTLDQTTLMSVVPMDEMTITITVDELDILSVSIGDQAIVTIDALPGTSFDGVVTDINQTASNNGGNTKYSAEITMVRDEKMLDGMNASSLITVELKENVLLIPVKAISEDTGKAVVYLGYDENNETLTNPVEVTTGMSDGENVEILSGLNEGQTYWYSYYDKVEDSGGSSGSGFSFSFGGGGGGRGGGPGGPV